MLNNLMREHVKNGKRVLPLKMSSRPGEDLKHHNTGGME